jgi:hypothetical protein
MRPQMYISLFPPPSSARAAPIRREAASR